MRSLKLNDHTFELTHQPCYIFMFTESVRTKMICTEREERERELIEAQQGEKVQSLETAPSYSQPGILYFGKIG